MLAHKHAIDLGARQDKHSTEQAFRVDEYTESSYSEDGLPRGFPKELTTKLAWHGPDLAKKLTYIYHLTDNDRLEIEYALAAFYGLGLDSDQITRETFPLPHFKHVLEEIASIIYEGIGFLIIRGLQNANYTTEDSTTIFLGLQSYIAEKRGRQDENGNMIVHITPDPVAAPNPMRKFHVRYSNKAVPFHTDPDADVLAFQTRTTATRGGKCVLSSAHTIYNELARTRPDVIQTLARPDWPFALPYFHQRAILFHHDGRVMLHYTRGALLGTRSHPRPSSVPQVSARQREALDLLDATAERHRVEIALCEGDVHFVNNLALVHRRDRFEDHGGGGGDGGGGEGGGGGRGGTGGGLAVVARRRHLVRMHLRSEGRLAWPIPPALRPFWNVAFAEAGVQRKWHVDPMTEAYFPLAMMADA